MDKVFLVTGAGHFPGVGSSVAVALLSRGDRVIVNSRSFDNKWSDIQEDYQDRLMLMPGDITQNHTRQQIVQDAIGTWGRIDGLVNNASTGAAQWQDDLITHDCWQENFAVNVSSVYYLSELCRPHLVDARGSIVNVSSRAGLQPGTGNNLAYAVAKAALNHLTKNQAMMFAPYVTVNAVCPGLVPSQRLQDIFDDQFQVLAEKHSKLNLTGQLISPESVAEAVLYLLGAKNITGQLLPICGGSSILPKF